LLKFTKELEFNPELESKIRLV